MITEKLCGTFHADKLIGLLKVYVYISANHRCIHMYIFSV